MNEQQMEMENLRLTLSTVYVSVVSPIAYTRRRSASYQCKGDRLFLYNDKLCFYVDPQTKFVPPKLHFPQEIASLKPIGLFNDELYCLGETDIKTLNTKNHCIENLTSLPFPMITAMLDEEGFIYGIAVDDEDNCLMKYVKDTKAWKSIVAIPGKLFNPILMKNKHFYIIDGENEFFLRFDVDLLEWIRLPIPHYLLSGKIDWFMKDGELNVFGYDKQKFLIFNEDLDEWVSEISMKKESYYEYHCQDTFTIQALCYHPGIQEIFGVSSKGHLCRISFDEACNTWECCCLLNAFDPPEDGDISGMFPSCTETKL